MKNVISFALAAVLMFAAACSEPLNESAEVEAPQTQGAETPTVSHWGNKIEDPYSVCNMRKAFKELMQTTGNKLSKVGVTETQIEPTHLHLKFFPKNFEELRMLDSDTVLNVVPVPFNYDLENFDGVYRDPECPEGQPTYQYAVVRIGYELPNVEYEVLDSLFMPFEDDYDKEAISKCAKFRSIWDDLELESVKLTGNFSEEDYNPPTLSKKYHPSGKVTYVDDVRGTVGVPNVRVHVNFSTHSHNFYTNEDGSFEANGRFTWKVHFHVYFKCPDATVYINDNTGPKNVAGSYGGKKTKCYNFGIDNAEKKNYAIIITAAYEMFQKYHGVNRTHKDHINVFYLNDNANPTNYLKFTNAKDGWGVKMYNMTSKHSQSFGTAINAFAGIVLENNKGIQIDNQDSKFNKAWRSGVEWYITKEIYKSDYNTFETLFKDLMDDDQSTDDNVSGFSINTINTCISKTTTWLGFRNELKNNTNSTTNKNNIDKLFTYWQTKL